MVKTVEEICNSIINNRGELMRKTTSHTLHRLSESVGCNDFNANPYGSIALYDEDGLYNMLERTIVQKLASAIDENSVEKVKKLKEQYGELKEFASAKKLLNRKCKEVWNVYSPQKNVPKEAMKVLGITNCPDLDSLLADCINYYEKDGKSVTSCAIASILKNNNMSYDIEDIHKYLEKMYKTNRTKYNFNTIKYLISEHKYNKDKLKSLGVDKEQISKVLKTLPFKIRLKFLLG